MVNNAVTEHFTVKVKSLVKALNVNDQDEVIHQVVEVVAEDMPEEAEELYEHLLDIIVLLPLPTLERLAKVDGLLDGSSWYRLLTIRKHLVTSGQSDQPLNWFNGAIEALATGGRSARDKENLMQTLVAAVDSGRRDNAQVQAR